MSITRASTCACLLGLALALTGCQKIDRGGFDYDSGADSYPEPYMTGGSGASDDDDDDDDDDGGTSDGGGGGGEPIFECNPGDADACAADEKCAVVLDENNDRTIYKCVPDDSSLAPYETCQLSINDGQDGCPGGTLCIPITEDQDYGSCLPGCQTSGDCGTGVCIVGPFSDIAHCADPCDPLLPTCPGAMRCLATSDRFGCMVGTEEDIGAQAEPCLGFETRGCAEGFACQWGELIPDCLSATGLCCTSLCDVSELDECASPMSCFPVFPNPAPGFEGLGVCLVPA